MNGRSVSICHLGQFPTAGDTSYSADYKASRTAWPWRLEQASAVMLQLAERLNE